MECVICKNGKTESGFVTFTLERNGVIVVFKNVPALVCKNCGDFYLTEETSKWLLERAANTIEKGVEFEDFDVSSDLEKRKEMVEKSGQMGVPVIIIGGQLTVGFNKSKLAELLGL